MASSSSEERLCYGPEDPSLLFHQHEHISASLLANGTSNAFRVRRTESKVWTVQIHPTVRQWLDVWGFKGLLECGRPMRIDNELITALIERWRPETHCFHLPVGEVTVTLEDVQSLWGLRADGRVFTGRDYPIGYDDWPSKCRDMLGWIPDVENETKQGGLLMTSLINQTTIPLEDGLYDYVYMQRARIHALILLGGLIIPDTTGCKVPFMWLNAFDDAFDVSSISWGSAALAFLYHYLCEASIGRQKRDVGGPMVLLQLWAWERMPTLRPSFLISPMHAPYTPSGAKWHGVTEIGNAPRYSVAHYRDQLSLIRPGQFVWTPYTDCILPDYCIDSTASFLCDTYLVCWSFVEAHEAGRVCRQFNRYQGLPEYRDRMLGNAGHLSKSHRRGRKGADWAKVHKFYIAEWDLRHDRSQSTFHHATASMEGSCHPGYMAWYNRIAVSYLVQPGTQATVGMNESASSLQLTVETLQRVWHLTSEHDNDPRLRQIREMVSETLRATNHTDVMEYPATQRRNAAMPPRPPTSLRHGLPGVRTGGHGWTRQHRLSQQQQPQPEYTVPSPLHPEYDPPGWAVYPGSQSQLSGASHEHSQWGARSSCDSFFGGGSDWNAARAGRDPYFQNYQFVDPVGEEEGEDEEGEGEEEEGGESGSEEDDEVAISRPPTEGSSRPTGKSSSSKIGKAMHNVLRGFSTRKNKGKAPTKFTPSGK